MGCECTWYMISVGVGAQKTLDVICIFFFIADITPEELFNMFFGGFGGISGGKKKNVSLIK